jgi:hypothetical protein
VNPAPPDPLELVVLPPPVLLELVLLALLELELALELELLELLELELLAELLELPLLELLALVELLVLAALVVEPVDGPTPLVAPMPPPPPWPGKFTPSAHANTSLPRSDAGYVWASTFSKQSHVAA